MAQDASEDMGRLRPAAWSAPFPWVVLLLGAMFSLYLQTSIRGETFFSGDGGVKFLLTEQFAAGDFGFDLRLPAEPWVQALWNEGLYPLCAPFEYRVADRHYIQYPIFFSLLTAPGLAAFGYRGLYIVPVLSLWATWLALFALCRRWGLDAISSAAGLLIAVFASPLTMYGAMYWEHTLGVALAFFGLSLLVVPVTWLRPACNAGAAGFVMALAAWVRSEYFDLLAATAVVAFIAPWLGCELRGRRAFVLGSGVGIALLFGMNAFAYGLPLGPHSLSVVQTWGWGERLQNAVAVFVSLGSQLIKYFPLAGVAVPLCIPFLGTNRHGIPPRGPARVLLLVGGLYVVTVPLLLPSIQLSGDGGKQWGPRFLLVLVPLVAALAAGAIQAASRSSGSVARAAAIGVLLIVSLPSVIVNSIYGTVTLREDYAHRVLPALRALQSRPAEVLAFSDPFAVQEMAALVRGRAVFFLDSQEAFRRLGEAMLDRGEGGFLLVGDKPLSAEGPLSDSNVAGHFRIEAVARYGSYLVHQVELSRVQAAPPR